MQLKHLIRSLFIAASPLLCFLPNATAQGDMPAFNLSTTTVRIPLNMPGIIPDPAHTEDSELVYTIKGQLFKDGAGQLPTVAEGLTLPTTRKTPWETLAELAEAQRTGSFEGTVALYTASSRAAIDRMLPPEQRSDYSAHVSQTEYISVLLGYEHAGGIAVVYEQAPLGNSNAMLKKTDDGYLLTAVENDSSPMPWNLAMYAKYLPEPPGAADITAQPDSLPADSSGKLDFRLRKAGNWIVLWDGPVGEPTQYIVEDNGKWDADPADSKISFDFFANRVGRKGTIDLFAIESNYPIDKVTEEAVKTSLKLKIKVY